MARWIHRFDELVRWERREPPRAGSGGGQEPLARELLDDTIRLDPVDRGEAGEFARGLRTGPAGRQVEAGALFRHPVLGEEFEKARAGAAHTKPRLASDKTVPDGEGRADPTGLQGGLEILDGEGVFDLGAAGPRA